MKLIKWMKSNWKKCLAEVGADAYGTKSCQRSRLMRIYGYNGSK